MSRPYINHLKEKECEHFSVHCCPISRRAFCLNVHRLFLPVLKRILLYEDGERKSEIAFLFNSARFPKEHCFLGGSQASPICPSGKSNIQMKMSMEHWWNDAAREKPKYSEESLS
jgi:hypothetical protein